MSKRIEEGRQNEQIASIGDILIEFVSSILCFELFLLKISDFFLFFFLIKVAKISHLYAICGRETSERRARPRENENLSRFYEFHKCKQFEDFIRVLKRVIREHIFLEIALLGLKRAHIQETSPLAHATSHSVFPIHR